MDPSDPNYAVRTEPMTETPDAPDSDTAGDAWGAHLDSQDRAPEERDGRYMDPEARVAPEIPAPTHEDPELVRER